MLSRSTHITLLERLGGGPEGPDQEAWRAFVERYGGLIRGYARVRGVQEADCDDLLQDVMVSLAKAMPGFRYDPGKGSFRGYLRTTVGNAISKRARQKRPLSGLEDLDGLGPGGKGPSAGPEGSDGDWEQQWRQHHTRLAMRQVESEFNATDLEAFQRYALLRHDAQTVAKDLGVSVESVYQAKSRVLRRLTKLIGEQVAEEG